MAQFDSLIILPLILSLFIVLILYYSMSIGTIIPDFFEVKKFREKKVQSQCFYKLLTKNKLTNSINSYKSIFF